MASNDEPSYPPSAGGALPYPPVGNDPPGGALPYPAPAGSDPPAGGLPYPTGDTSGALPYPSSSGASLPYPPTDSASTLPYPPMNSNSPPGHPGGATNAPSDQSASKIGFEGEGKTYTDAPPPYSPPVGGTPYPTPAGAPGQLPPPQPGYAAYPAQPSVYPQAPGTVTVTRTVQSTGPQVIVTGTCPTCRVGVLSENFTLLGICCAFWLFPLGIICCLSMREKRCTNCGSVFA
ncbi:uncharacterized protein [Amphiura filiformis]|uniref:uncharacterized protein n=1 Tax=Amphiura filiformis TaxID=82378 RepID=UPI003B22689A